jgi:hypothetical protein
MQQSRGMPHVVLSEVGSAIDIQTGAVVSRVIFRDDRTEVTVFGFDAGEVKGTSIPIALPFSVSIHTAR